MRSSSAHRARRAVHDGSSRSKTESGTRLPMSSPSAPWPDERPVEQHHRAIGAADQVVGPDVEVTHRPRHGVHPRQQPARIACGARPGSAATGASKCSRMSGRGPGVVVGDEAPTSPAASRCKARRNPRLSHASSGRSAGPGRGRASAVGGLQVLHVSARSECRPSTCSSVNSTSPSGVSAIVEQAAGAPRPRRSGAPSRRPAPRVSSSSSAADRLRAAQWGGAGRRRVSTLHTYVAEPPDLRRHPVERGCA